MKLADKLADASNLPLSPGTRFLAKALPVFVYSIFFPALLFFIPKFILDPWLQLPQFLTPVARAVLGGSLITLGLIPLLWSIRVQRVIGQGTPMPLMATQNLVVEKPYSYCRNPLYFGLINLFFGISILLGSISSLFMVLAFSVIILLFTRIVEEKELEKRFGEEYLAYKRTTPFIIPIPSLLRRKNTGEKQ
jgi:protein-S-isoprenylcysteine O-methyltransferase Ste14